MSDDILVQLVGIIAGDDFPLLADVEKAKQCVAIIEAPLRAENEKLRAALKPFADMAEKQAKLCLGPDIDHWLIGECDLTLGDLRAARAALEKKND